ncbi:hypothetical protein ABZ319_28555 [Nocardia sp. NPDC005978]|uniref:DUF7691 family protein n=1 Tax=Nocardia sp. NPDC005978 TaxID=3156725 RepID=UPI0033AD8B7F
MSRGFMVYAVDIQRIRAVIGSGDRELATELVGELGGELDSLDKESTYWYPGGTPPSGRDALVRMIVEAGYQDQPDVEKYAAVYGYCFERLCDHLGTALGNEGWERARGTWLAYIEDELGSIEVCFEPFEELISGETVPLPNIWDVPAIGCTPREFMAGMIEKLEPALSADIDEEVQEAVEQVVDWAKYCGSAELDLVCFYY